MLECENCNKKGCHICKGTGSIHYGKPLDEFEGWEATLLDLVSWMETGIPIEPTINDLPCVFYDLACFVRYLKGYYQQLLLERSKIQ